VTCAVSIVALEKHFSHASRWLIAAREYHWCAVIGRRNPGRAATILFALNRYVFDNDVHSAFDGSCLIEPGPSLRGSMIASVVFPNSL
jgi:hypothetical protein